MELSNSLQSSEQFLAAKKVLIATRSTGKQREIRSLLKHLPVEFVFPSDLGLEPSAAEDDLETAATYTENATNKAVYFSRLSGLSTAADDSGIEVAYLDGSPGVRSCRFAGVAENRDEANNQRLLDKLAGVAADQRTARFRCVVVFVEDPNAKPQMFEGSCSGRILSEPDGAGGFGYDPLFFSDDLQSSFGRVSECEKAAVSHRGRAFRKFAEWLVERL